MYVVEYKCVPSVCLWISQDAFVRSIQALSKIVKGHVPASVEVFSTVKAYVESNSLRHSFNHGTVVHSCVLDLAICPGQLALFSD